MLSKNAKICVNPDAKRKICVSPNVNAKPQRQSVEYRLRWVTNAKFLRWPCTFHVFCVDFICVCSQHKPSFQCNVGLRSRAHPEPIIPAKADIGLLWPGYCFLGVSYFCNYNACLLHNMQCNTLTTGDVATGTLRIPTPNTPLSSLQVNKMLKR